MLRALWWCLLCLGPSRLCDGFCPAGFDNMPPAWKIPDWPRDMPEEEAGRLNVITLGGFTKPEINDEYLEGPTVAFLVQGEKTYWSVSGEYFLYYCKKFRKWRAAGVSGFDDNKNGNCFAFASDAKPDRDILSPELQWAEVVKGKWGVSEVAGVTGVGGLAEQFEALKAERDAADAAAAAGECEAADMSEGDGGQRKSKCPIMPAVNAVKAQASKVSKWAKKWLRRLFPKLLPAPEDGEDEEEAAPRAGGREDEESGDSAKSEL